MKRLSFFRHCTALVNKIRWRTPAGSVGKESVSTPAQDTALSVDRFDIEVMLQALQDLEADSVEYLLVAAGKGFFLNEQPPGTLRNEQARKVHLRANLKQRQYSIRRARFDDIPVLQTLEQSCWPAQLQTPVEVLTKRIANYPDGQLVLVQGTELVGVIYSQAIEDVECLNGIEVAQVDALHRTGAPVIQLLAVNILPRMQQHSLGDQLLEFMLIYRSLQNTVQSVVAITLCKNFNRSVHTSLEEYIVQRNSHGVLADPILRFHELHGATIVRVMPGYRPSDLKNEGCGVLVQYDIHNRLRNDFIPEHTPMDQVVGRTLNHTALRNAIQEAVLSCLEPQHKAGFLFDRPLMEMGLNSADLLELNENIAQRFQLKLHPAFFFQYNTTQKIVAYLSEALQVKRLGINASESLTENSQESLTQALYKISSEQSQNQSSENLQQQESINKQNITPQVDPRELQRGSQIAIVGMACRLPGGINTPEALWACLCEGSSVMSDVPSARWQWPGDIDPVDQHQGIARGGFLENVTDFDAPFFRISPAEAQSMDPQQRILLELSWQTLEHAGYAPSGLAATRTGVFIGASGSDYSRLIDQLPEPIDAHYGTGVSMAVLANRISYFFDFNGPSVLIDTACSSSLVAVHQAMQSLQLGECEQALVGGINLICHPANSIAYYKAGMLSPDGLCKTFDQQANGYVRSEGSVVFLFKPLAKAQADQDVIYGVLKGSACNHGGQASGLTVPNPGLQAELLQSAWRAAGIQPSALSYVEAHGTGTSLGDPLEVQGLKQAFLEASYPDAAAAKTTCGLGSVKANLGHLEAAAGVTGLLKVILCLRHSQLPSVANFKSLNQHIDLSETGLYVVEKLRAWPAPIEGQRRLAGLSSFGSGGTNAHVVVEQYPAAAVSAQDSVAEEPVIFVLSAKTRQQLEVYVQRYLDWLQAPVNQTVSLNDLARQLQFGREEMARRLAFVTTSRQDLLAQLQTFLAKAKTPSKELPSEATSIREHVLDDIVLQEHLLALIARKDLDAIAMLWASGVAVPWSLLYGEVQGLSTQWRRIAMPTYPFAAHQYWLPNQPVPERTKVSKQAVSATVKPDLEAAVNNLYAPLWRPVFEATVGRDAALESSLEALRSNARLLLIGADVQQQREICAQHPLTVCLDLEAHVTIESLSRVLQHFSDWRQVVWIAPQSSVYSSDNLIADQDLGVLYIFKLLKALLAEGYQERELSLTFITRCTQQVFNLDHIAPAHAGVHGLTGALAKEHPFWTVRSLDLDDAETVSVAQWLKLAPDPDGEVLARRNGQLFKRWLCPVDAFSSTLPAYRQSGTYVVLGGAGGLGEAWTKELLLNYQSQVIWLGRRPLDAAIQSTLDRLTQQGGRVIYLSADASKLDSLQQAYTEIKKFCPAVHGVIHSAVADFDLSIAEMDEQRFRNILSVKVDASINLAEVFKNEPLDFIVYFSSIVSFEKSGGLCGYAVGSAFEDAFALSLAQRQQRFAVKVINWGHWEIGCAAVLSDAAKIRFKKSGGVPIQPAEAMVALQTLLMSPLQQLVMFKTKRPEAVSYIALERRLQVVADSEASALLRLPQDHSLAREQVHALMPLSIFNNVAMHQPLLTLFAATLQSLDLLDPSRSLSSPEVPEFYAKWLDASRKLLAEREQAHAIPNTLEQAWSQWAEIRRSQLTHKDLAAALDLVEACLRALPEILSGRLRSTDVIFPDSSMRRVDGIYQKNAVADYFNQLVAESLVFAIETHVQSDPQVRLRILEIGAGSGGTTATLLPRLKPYLINIVEYAYTDISKAFLFHAEEHFVKSYPFVQPKLFNIEQPLAGQAIQAQTYDMVIATNVLHATRNIRTTLANVKAVLRKNGLLVLNEISTESLFAHLTFGLLEGWWLSEDQALRIPDAPGLFPDTWAQVLRQQGFTSAVVAPHTQHLGQQVLVAQSDGVVLLEPMLRSYPTLESVTQAPRVQGIVQASDEALRQASNVYLKKIVAKTLRMDSADLDPLEPLQTYGIDSILTVQITKALRAVIPTVQSTLLFQCQTVNAVSQFLIAHDRSAMMRLVGMQMVDTNGHEFDDGPASSSQSNEARTIFLQNRVSQSSIEGPIAVIGMSCHFSQAQSLEAYWEMLKNGEESITEIPNDRWSLEGFYHADPDEAVEQGKSYSKWGGFLENVTEFDPLFFNISPKEAIAMDPQERLFLQTAWETLEDAGYTRELLVDTFKQQLGVFVGITRTGFDLFGPELWRNGHALYPHTSFSSVANRVSYFLNARGPSVPVDTMCSSSLTAIHQASQSLLSGECKVALAGGVNIYLHPSGYVGLSASHMLSKDGVCRSFGKDGNGFVPGEGVGAVLLKPLAQAIADNDHIYATIRATHVNHGGKTNGYTVPNPLAQAELIDGALRKGGIDPRTISYIEAHGTGTELGDPIEVEGLTQAFRQHTQATGFCALGSAKSNMGHLEAAAGIAGFIKVILQLQHRQLVPSLHARELNPNIDFSQTPFFVQKTLEPWARPILTEKGESKEYPLIAGVSAFGAGGANAHVIIQEYSPATDRQRAPEHDCLFVLSAKNDERLKAYAAKLRGFIALQLAQENGRRIALRDLAYTLQVGREAMESRLACVVNSLSELTEKLDAYLSEQTESADLYVGRVKSHKDVISAFAADASIQQTLAGWFQQRQYDRLLGLWTKGLEVDWSKCYAALGGQFVLPQRISLPTYPFAKNKYWLPLAVNRQDDRVAVVKQTPIISPALVVGSSAIVAPAARIASIPEALTAAINQQGKPRKITLLAPEQFPKTFNTPATARQFVLSALNRDSVTASQPVPLSVTRQDVGLLLSDLGQGVFSMRCGNTFVESIELADICSSLIETLQCLSQRAAQSKDQTQAPKVLILSDLDRLFAYQDSTSTGSDSKASCVAEVIVELVECSIPVVVALQGENSINALLLATACDVIVCCRQASYAFNATSLSEAMRSLVTERLGHQTAARLFSLLQPLTSVQLRQAGVVVSIIEKIDLDDEALQIARDIAQGSLVALQALKGHLNQTMRLISQSLIDPSQLTRLRQFEKEFVQGGMLAVDVNDMSEYEYAEPNRTKGIELSYKSDGDNAVPVPVALASKVVRLEKYANGVVVMKLCDLESKNTFTSEFVQGVITAFEHINLTPEYKVVVLTGYDHYFACGGTKQGLLDIQSGRAKFTDEQSYSMPLLCEIPVIAAMQGHAIGAGWTMGLYCDLAIYSEESVYQSPYMRYGFTPGAGSTLLFTQRFGSTLGNEILLTAREYQGREFKRRGVNVPVVPRAEVLAYARRFANRLASESREVLVKQKNQRSAFVRGRLQGVFEQELAMHATTFVGNPLVIENIGQHFNQVAVLARIPPLMIATEASDELQDRTEQEVHSTLTNSEEVLELLRNTLIEELHMQHEGIENDVAFIDMGLDSIIAVTWIRKINKLLGLEIGATKVYSYPNLLQFSDFVLTLLSSRELRSVQLEKTEQVAQFEQPAKVAIGPQSDIADALRTWLRETLAKELLMQADLIDDDMKFIDIGLDSITAVTWIRRINARLGLSLGATKVYSYPTLSEFYLFIQAQVNQHPNTVHAPQSLQLESHQPLSQTEVSKPISNDKKKSISVAIIGMAGQFPKAPDIQKFWNNLLEGRDCISEIPPTRWSIDEYYDQDRQSTGKTVCKRMGLLEDLDIFDPLFFNIAPSEAEYMDPQQRLFLQNSWRCIEDAGYDPAELSGSLCGVFVGCAASDYSQQLAVEQTHNAQAMIGDSIAILPARIAYFLNLQGPCLAIDTACSSSLVALANACDSLVLGNSDLALAGGVYVINGPDIHVKMSQAGMLSSDGACFSFDQRANGFVPGEGVGVLLLKRLEDAEEDGDDIYCVIRGWGVNQDGKTNGITAPNEQAQARLQTSVYRKFGINPEHIELIEAHGTATKLGDPIEIEALRQSFGEFTQRKNYCALGSVKSNIGHLATAAGVTSVIKSALALKHTTLPPTINYQKLNEHIQLENSPFFVNTKTTPWPASEGHKRLVATSSFGFSGTNAHMVLEEFSTSQAPVRAALSSLNVPVILTLSAKNKEQLLAYAQAFSKFLHSDLDTLGVTLADVAYTLQVGRTPMPCRLALIACTLEEFKLRLATFVATGVDGANCLFGEVGHSSAKGTALNGPVASERVQSHPRLSQHELVLLAKRWVAGEIIDWHTCYDVGSVRRRHGLPTYPFAREHYWIPAVETESVSRAETLAVRPNALAQSIDLAKWSAVVALPQADWQGRMQHYQAKKVLVIYSDEAERVAFHQLLIKLAQASGMVGVDHFTYARIGAQEVSHLVHSAESLLVLVSLESPSTDCSDVLKKYLKEVCDQSKYGFFEIVLSMQVAVLEAERCAKQIRFALSHLPAHCLFLTHEDNINVHERMQRVFTEWLAFEVLDPLLPTMRQIHYLNTQRLTRINVAEPKIDVLSLISKQWLHKEAQPLSQPHERLSAIVIVNEDSLKLCGALIQPEDFKNVIFIGDESIAPHQIQNSINFNDAKSARISAHILIDQYDHITHLIDLSELRESAQESDSDNHGKTVFYQTLIGAYTNISILYLTKGLQKFRTTHMSLAGAKFAGLIKMLSAEYTHVDARCIDIDQSTYDAPLALRKILLTEFGAELHETELCYRNGQRFAPVLSLVDSTPSQQSAGMALVQDGVYVISGGTNGVGLEIAKYLVSKGCQNLVLMGITDLPPRELWGQVSVNDNLVPYVQNKLVALSSLEQTLDNLWVYTGSLTDLNSLNRYFDKVRRELGPIKGVIHSACIYSDPDVPSFVTKDLDRMRKVWEPKINGLENLHTIFESDTLTFFVSFSSLTGLIPHMARGASDYAMANAFVDFFSAYQQQQNSRVQFKSIVWSDWNQTGAFTRISDKKMALVEDNFYQMGMRTFSIAEGCQLFEQAMACTHDSQVFIGFLDRSRFEQNRLSMLCPTTIQSATLAAQESAGQHEEVAVPAQDKGILYYLDQWEAEKRAGLEVPALRITEKISLDQIKQLEPELIHRIYKLLFAGSIQQTAQQESVDLFRLITQTLMEVLKLKTIDATQSFQNYGLDSISAMVFATRLEKKLKQQVKPQWLIEYATVESLSRHLMSQSSKYLLD